MLDQPNEDESVFRVDIGIGRIRSTVSYPITAGGEAEAVFVRQVRGSLTTRHLLDRFLRQIASSIQLSATGHHLIKLRQVRGGREQTTRWHREAIHVVGKWVLKLADRRLLQPTAVRTRFVRFGDTSRLGFIEVLND